MENQKDNSYYSYANFNLPSCNDLIMSKQNQKNFRNDHTALI